MTRPPSPPPGRQRRKRVGDITATEIDCHALAGHARLRRHLEFAQDHVRAGCEHAFCPGKLYGQVDAWRGDTHLLRPPAADRPPAAPVAGRERARRARRPKPHRGRCRFVKSADVEVTCRGHRRRSCSLERSVPQRLPRPCTRRPRTGLRTAPAASPARRVREPGLGCSASSNDTQAASDGTPRASSSMQPAQSGARGEVLVREVYGAGRSLQQTPPSRWGRRLDR